MSPESKEKILREIYTTYHGKVFRTIYKIVRNQEDAEEVIQDVFLDAYTKIDSFKGNASIGTWIYRIAVNKSLDHLKKKSRKKRFAWLTSIFDSDTGALIYDYSDEITPQKILESKESEAIVFYHINNLPNRQKEAFLLFQVEQLSYEEIAQAMNVSIFSVESLLFRAKQTLKQKLEKEYNTILHKKKK
jgi:RNA polymerase sigma-70 factor (ECF subfamily)